MDRQRIGQTSSSVKSPSFHSLIPEGQLGANGDGGDSSALLAGEGALASQKEAAPARNSRHYSARSHRSAVWLLGGCFSLAAVVLAPWSCLLPPANSSRMALES